MSTWCTCCILFQSWNWFLIFFQTIEVAPFFHNSEAITGVRKKNFRLAITKKWSNWFVLGKSLNRWEIWQLEAIIWYQCFFLVRLSQLFSCKWESSRWMCPFSRLQVSIRAASVRTCQSSPITKLFINNRTVESQSNELLDVHNPATNEVGPFSLCLKANEVMVCWFFRSGNLQSADSDSGRNGVCCGSS